MRSDCGLEKNKIFNRKVDLLGTNMLFLIID